MKTTAFPHLFSPIDLGPLRVKNRIVMAPMGTRLPSSMGMVNAEVINYYLARARGGVGLIVFQYTSVTPDGAVSPRTPMIYDDRFLPPLRQLTEEVHEAGAKIGIQLAHCGAAGPYANTLARPKAPSAIGVLGGEVPLELTSLEIEERIEAFAQAAGRAKEAGFDAVVIHACHGYLVHQFLSPLTNRRSDEWGGDVERRARFAVEVARRMRAVVGPEFPVLARLVVYEGVPGGITLEDSQTVAQLLVRAGLTALDITGGINETFYLTTPPSCLPYGTHAPLGEAIKKAVDVPVILVGRIHDPQVAEDLIVSGKADMVALGRQMLADPDFARKAQEGRVDEIRTCLACSVPQCHGRTFGGVPVGCVVNPVLAREGYYSQLTPVATSKKVLVVGGGPAGMEVAQVASRRGHRVTLVEEAPDVGGQLIMGCVPPHKDGITRLLAYYRRQLQLAKVEVRTGTHADRHLIEEFKPDTVVVATGGKPLYLDIPGLREYSVSAWDVLRGSAKVGDKVAVIGGGDVGCEVAEYLAQGGRQVRIYEMLKDIAPNFSMGAKPLLLQRFRQLGVDFIVQAKVVRVEEGCLHVDRGGIVYRQDGFDTIVLCVGTASRSDLVEELQGTGLDVRTIGDCVRPRTIFEAIREGYELGFSLS